MDNLCCNCREQPISQEKYGTCDDEICIGSVIKLRAKVEKLSSRRIRKERKRALGWGKPLSPRTTILGLRKLGFTRHKNFKLIYKGNTYKDTSMQPNLPKKDKSSRSFNKEHWEDLHGD